MRRGEVREQGGGDLVTLKRPLQRECIYMGMGVPTHDSEKPTSELSPLYLRGCVLCLVI